MTDLFDPASAPCTDLDRVDLDLPGGPPGGESLLFPPASARLGPDAVFGRRALRGPR